MVLGGFVGGCRWFWMVLGGFGWFHVLVTTKSSDPVSTRKSRSNGYKCE